MDALSEIFKNYQREELKYTAAHEFQARVLEIIDDLGIKERMHGVVFKAFRRNRPKAEAAYKISKEKNNPAAYFIWLLTHQV